MAITINTDFQDYSPTYNRVEADIISSSVAGKVNFQYVVDVVTTIHGTQRFLIPPRPNNNHGIIKVGRYLAGFIIEQIAPYDSTGSFTQGLTEMIIEYHCEYYEGWDVAGAFIVDPNALGAVVGKTAYVWDAAFPEHRWITRMNNITPFTPWVMNTTNGATTQFLTNYKTPKVDLTDLGWSYLLTDTVTDIDYVEVKTYDSAGALIQTAQSANVSNGLTIGKIKSVATSPQSLNNIAPALLAGSQQIITSSVATYTVQIFESTPTAVSELLTFTIGECTRYEKYRLHFLNELGGFDSFNFLARSQQKSTVKRTSYTKAQDVITAGGLTYSHEDLGSMDYYVRSTDKIKLRSEFLTGEENTWLKELIESPNVLWETTDTDGNVVFFSVKVTSNNWTRKEILLDKTFILELDIEVSMQNTRQRR